MPVYLYGTDTSTQTDEKQTSLKPLSLSRVILIEPFIHGDLKKVECYTLAAVTLKEALKLLTSFAVFADVAGEVSVVGLLVPLLLAADALLGALVLFQIHQMSTWNAQTEEPTVGLQPATRL